MCLCLCAGQELAEHDRSMPAILQGKSSSALETTQKFATEKRSTITQKYEGLIKAKQQEMDVAQKNLDGRY